MSAYVIYEGEVLDHERYEIYKQAAAASIEAAAGRYLARGGRTDVLEGQAPTGRAVVLEFPDRDAALAWYRGEQYTRARSLRAGAARARMYLVDGCDPAGDGRP